MTRADLLVLARLEVPEAPSSVISDDNVYIYLNQAALEFVTIAEALPTSTLFNSADSTGEYLLSSEVTTFLKIRKEGLWWYDSDNSKWIKLRVKTRELLDQMFPFWRDADASKPQHYVIEGDDIIVYPKVETGGTDHFRLYHWAISTNMTAAIHYPFTGSTTRYSFLAKYEENLIYFYKYKAKKILGYDAEAEEAKQMFQALALQCGADLKDRKDIGQVAHVRPVSQNRTPFGSTFKRTGRY